MHLFEHKHRCLVRQLIKWRKEWGLVKFRQYIEKTKFEQRVYDDFIEQYKKGNLGERDAWL
jgi:hypothetical protein